MPTTSSSTQATTFFPTIPVSHTTLNAPVHAVTLLEDRAQVTRQGTISLEAGRHKLLIWDVSPVLQDVSLRAESPTDTDETNIQIHDTRIRRAFRVRREDKPEDIREIDDELRHILRQFEHIATKRERTEGRYKRLFDMLAQGTKEIPEDAAWGLVNHQAWHDTFETLFRRSRTLLEESMAAYFQQQELLTQRNQLATKRNALTQWEKHFLGCVELDVELTTPQDVALAVHYVVPNALWRPLHRAQLKDNGSLSWTCSAAVWQHTGEDWDNATLSFSTARSSLGTEAPVLSDDLLEAQRKAEELRIEQREVTLQSTGPQTSSASSSRPTSVALPGVDDGGDLQHLQAPTSQRVVADGSPHIIPLFRFHTQAQTSLVCTPELTHHVFLKSLQTNKADHPLLAGPVELLRNHGFVGWTKILFVAPGETFQLSFGPDDGIRINRTTERETETDIIDKWRHTRTETKVFVSNLTGTHKQLDITERIPVSEVEYVKSKLHAEDTTPPTTPDENGFCKWTIELAAHDTTTCQLVWTLSESPDVQR